VADVVHVPWWGGSMGMVGWGSDVQDVAWCGVEWSGEE